MELPYSEACENNKQPILDVLARYLADGAYVFEIGSGTGQHAVHFAEHLPGVTWQTSDVAANLPGISKRLDLSGLSGLPSPVALDVLQKDWPTDVQAFYSANTAHIMPWKTVEVMFARLGEALRDGGLFFLYGPFNYGGEYTSESNARFDQWLKHAASGRGIRDFEAVDALANNHRLTLIEDHPMPANNRLLVWRKRLPNQ